MICGKCTAEIPDGSKFCGHCGSVQGAPAPAPPASNQGDSAARATMFGMGAIKILPSEPAPAPSAEALAPELSPEPSGGETLVAETLLDLQTPTPEPAQTLVGAPIASLMADMQKGSAPPADLAATGPMARPTDLAATQQISQPPASQPAAQAAPQPVAQPVSQPVAPTAAAAGPVAGQTAPEIRPVPKPAARVEPVARPQTPSVIVDSDLGREAQAVAAEQARAAQAPEPAPVAADTAPQNDPPATAAATQAAADGDDKKGFRETMWFMDALDPDALSDIETEDIQARSAKFDAVSDQVIEESERRKFSLNVDDDRPTGPAPAKRSSRRSGVTSARNEPEAPSGGISSGLVAAVVLVLAGVGVAAWFVFSG